MWISINKPKKISLKVAQDIWTSKSSGNKKVLLGTKNPRPYRDEIWIISSSPLTCVCVCGKYWHYGAVLFTLVHNESLSGNAELCKQLHYWFLLTLSHTFLKILFVPFFILSLCPTIPFFSRFFLQICKKTLNMV